MEGNEHRERAKDGASGRRKRVREKEGEGRRVEEKPSDS